MNTLKDISEALGGANKFGEIIGEKMTTAYAFLRKGYVPMRHWRTLMTAINLAGKKMPIHKFTNMMLDAEEAWRASNGGKGE